MNKYIEIPKEYDGMKLLELVERTEPHPYKILLARVNGTDTELTESINAGDSVEFLDMRTHSAALAYQRTVKLLYLAAVNQVYESKNMQEVRVEIDNSLNKGLFTKIKGVVDIDEDDIAEIELCMRELVKLDLPVIKETLTKAEGIRVWKEYGYTEKADLLESIEGEYETVFYRLDVPVADDIRSYRNYFFGPMTPSTGYIDLFELRKYQGGILLRYPYYNKPNEMPEYRDDFKIYEAFGEEHDWLKLLHTQYLSDMNKIIAEDGAKDLILLSEALHEKKIVEIADEITNRDKRIILIAGPSSSGKTTFARRLCVQLRVNGLMPLYMGTDDYFVDRDYVPLDENGEKDYESLRALDVDLFSTNMNDLLNGRMVDLPEFDFIEGKKKFGKRITCINKKQPIVIEGIHALNGCLTEQIDNHEKFKIYISPLAQLNIDSNNRVPTTDARMLRRMVRDYKYRGHSASGTIMDWPKVRAGEDKNIFPYNGEADVVFNSALAYETCLLKKYAEPLLKAIDREDSAYSEAQRLLEFFKFFNVIENEEDIPNNSIIREFIGGSVFVG